MAKKDKNESCGASMDGMGCCKVEALISVDERGQMVLPKEIRNKANIHAGDKLAVITWGMSGKSCCISLIKAGDFTNIVKDLLGPMAKEIIKK